LTVVTPEDPTGPDPASGLVRSFISRPASAASGGPDNPDVGILRPYLLTAGRVTPVDSTLEIEAQVLTSELGMAAYHRLTFEHRDIVLLCRIPRSVAEVGAQLGYHVGVARVLVADLAALGHLTVRRPESRPALNLELVERVIRGLESLQ
jgi:hypothetical protein